MINQVLTLESNGIKSIGFDQANLYLSSVQFSTIDGLRDHCLDSTGKSSPSIPLNMIQKLTHTAGEEAITIYFMKQDGKQKSFFIEGFNPESAAEFIKEVAKYSGIFGTDATGGKKHDFTKHYLTLGGLAIFIPLFAWFASWPRTGRRSQIFKLLQDIGPNGIIIIGVIGVAIVLFQMFRQKRKPANQTILQRL